MGSTNELQSNISAEKPKAKNTTSMKLKKTIQPRPSKFLSVLEFTTAKFRMLANSHIHTAKYQCFIENNLSADKYSYWDVIMQFKDIAFKGITTSVLNMFIAARAEFRKFYYKKMYSLIRHIDDQCERRSLIKYTCLNEVTEMKRSIDQLVLCYPTFIGKDEDGGVAMEIENEKTVFYNYILRNIDRLLEEYYMVVDHYPHELVQQTNRILLDTAKNLSTNALGTYEEINETCRICGEGGRTKADVKMHYEMKNCETAVDHRCQCRTVFNSHLEWTNHWLRSDMPCSVIAWHIWRNTTLETGHSISYSCDGCAQFYIGFLEFWNHICNCPFFRVYLLANCQSCDETNKDALFYENNFQALMRTPHADKVGIKVLQDWTKLTTLNFKVKLLSLDEINLLHSIHILSSEGD